MARHNLTISGNRSTLEALHRVLSAVLSSPNRDRVRTASPNKDIIEVRMEDKQSMLTFESSPAPRQPKDPIRDAFFSLLGKEPPPFVKGYTTLQLTDEESYELSTWIHQSIEGTRLEWSTACGIIDAAEVIVSEAVGNANILPSPNKT